MRIKDPLEEAKLRNTVVWVTPENKIKFDNGEVVISTIWQNERKGMIELNIRASQCHSAFRNGRPYVKNTDWTWEEIDSFKSF